MRPVSVSPPAGDALNLSCENATNYSAWPSDAHPLAASLGATRGAAQAPAIPKPIARIEAGTPRANHRRGIDPAYRTPLSRCENGPTRARDQDTRSSTSNDQSSLAVPRPTCAMLGVPAPKSALRPAPEVILRAPRVENQADVTAVVGRSNSNASNPSASRHGRRVGEPLGEFLETLPGATVMALILTTLTAHTVPMAGCAGSRGLPPGPRGRRACGPVHTLDAVKLDVGGGRWARDERQRRRGRADDRAERAIASGTIRRCDVRTTQICRSGTRLSRRRPSCGRREDDRSGLGDREGAAGDGAVERVEPRRERTAIDQPMKLRPPAVGASGRKVRRDH